MYLVDSDILLPAGSTTEAPPDLEISELPPFQWNDLPDTATRRIAAYGLDQAMFMCFDAVNGVVVEQTKGAKDLPHILQVKASRDFKAKEFVLPPFSLLGNADLLLQLAQLDLHLCAQLLDGFLALHLLLALLGLVVVRREVVDDDRNREGDAKHPADGTG